MTNGALEIMVRQKETILRSERPFRQCGGGRVDEQSCRPLEREETAIGFVRLWCRGLGRRGLARHGHGFPRHDFHRAYQRNGEQRFHYRGWFHEESLVKQIWLGYVKYWLVFISIVGHCLLQVFCDERAQDDDQWAKMGEPGLSQSKLSRKKRRRTIPLIRYHST